MTSYQKLKERNAELLRDIVTMVDKPESLEALQIQTRYKLRIDLERCRLTLDDFRERRTKSILYYAGMEEKK